MHTHDISDWVETISASDGEDAWCVPKRPRFLDIEQDFPEKPEPMPPSPKRQRTAVVLDTADATPRAPQKTGVFDKLPSLSSGSSVSRSSSPSKQLWNAELQPSGFDVVEFEDYKEPPESLKTLVQDLEDIQIGSGILPKIYEAKLSKERGIRPFHFDSKATATDACQPLPPEFVHLVLKQAKYCDQHAHGESSWNIEVHGRLLEWALRTAHGWSGRLDYRYCVNASILPEFRPTNAPSKMVDFCFVIKADEQEMQVMKNLCLLRPALAINHTDWGDFEHNPIAISMETKAESGKGKREALLQMGTWHAAQWRSLAYGCENPRAFGFLPGIIVVGHEWSLVVTVLSEDTGKPAVLKELPMGNTKSILGVYMIIASLQCLKLWAETEFWPAFRKNIMQLQDENQ